MTLDGAEIGRLAAHLETAELERKPVAKITDQHPDMDWDDAYAVQYAIRRRKLGRGVRLAGLKMGLTSRAKMKQMGVEQPVYGFLCDYGAHPDSADIDASRFIHPRIEAEVAVVTKRALRGPGCHIGQALAAIDFVLPAVEIIDSRYENFRFDLKSVIADNTSAAGFVTGGRNADPDAVDLRAMGVVLEKNGAVVEVGAGAAVLGHPAASLAMLANMLAAREEEIPAGTFVMTGGITAAVEVGAGDNVNVRYQGLGSLTMRFV
jgi:2-oxo-3-hexenedioate decarboxylase